MCLSISDITQLDPHGTYSYTDYLTWQFTELVELWRGKIMRRTGAPTDQHQAVLGELHYLLKAYLRRQPCQVRMATLRRAPAPARHHCRPSHLYRGAARLVRYLRPRQD